MKKINLICIIGFCCFFILVIMGIFVKIPISVQAGIQSFDSGQYFVISKSKNYLPKINQFIKIENNNELTNTKITNIITKDIYLIIEVNKYINFFINENNLPKIKIIFNEINLFSYIFNYII